MLQTFRLLNRTYPKSGCSVQFENQTHNWKYSNRTKRKIVWFKY